MTDHRGTLGAARPVAARLVVTSRECSSIHLRSRKKVVTVGRVANTRNYGSSFRQRDLHAELVIVAMQVFDVLRNDLGFEILPRAASNAIAALMVGALPAAWVLKYARQVLPPAPAACASV